MAKKKLTFFTAGEDVFIRNLIVNLRDEYSVKTFFKGNPEEFALMMHDTDIAWFEWCDNLTAHATVQPKVNTNTKYVCRLHSYEMFTEWPKKVDWNKIDKLVFVNPVVRDYCLQNHQIRPDISTIIYNGVDMEKYTLPKDKKYNKKVVFIGYINYKKGPELMLQAFKAIHDYDPEFTFHIAGQHQDPRIKLYFDTIIPQLGFKINFDGWVQDMPTYLQDKDYVISTSLFESFQYSLAEGMAQGVFPLVHSWMGSNIFYPGESIWTFPSQLIDRIKWYEDQKDKLKIQTDLREHIKNNFSFDRQLKETKEMLCQL